MTAIIKMVLIIVALFIVAIVISTAAIRVRDLVLMLSPGVAQSEADKTRAANEKQAAEIRQAQETESYWNPKIDAAKQLMFLSLELAVPIGLSLIFLGLIFAMYRHSRMPDKLGRLPLRHLTDDVRLDAFGQFQHRLTAMAERPPVPESVTYAPTYSPRNDVVNLAPANIPDPSLAQLITMEKWCFGIEGENGSPVLWPGELKSGVIGGKPGFGKTMTVAFLAAQTIYRGGLVKVGDPHLGAGRSLANYLGPDMASAANVIGDKSEIFNMVGEVHDTLLDRQTESRNNPGTEFKQLLLILDEWAGLLTTEYRRKLINMLGNLIREGAKFRITVILISQIWKAGSTGGTELRNLSGWQIVHHSRKEDSRLLTGSNEVDPMQLKPGEAFLMGHPDGLIKQIRVPEVNADKLRAIMPPSNPDALQAVLDPPETSYPSDPSEASYPSGSRPDASDPSGRDSMLTSDPSGRVLCAREGCGEWFTPRKKSQKFHSDNCRKRANE